MTTIESISRSATERHVRNATFAPESRGPSTLISSKIADHHRERLAVVYVRQSTPQQMVEHRESLARQYALTDHAFALGWASERVLVIDEDLGLSGRSADARLGFQRLLAEVTMDHVGIVLGLEMSRLARSSKDWHHLFELCAVFGTLLADDDGVYDANDPNDRLLLGLKGIMSEVELYTMRNRLGRGMLNKARRGELFLHVPVGYVKTHNGSVAFDPDEQVRSTIELIFDKFDELGSGHAVHRYLLKHDIRLGVRPIDGPNRGQLEWRRPTSPLVFSILKHPIYAGAYVYGRCPCDPKRLHTHKTDRKWVPPEQWKVLLPDRMPAYITWDRYLNNQRRLNDNRALKASKGRPRNGEALLGGLVYCGACGHRLSTAYQQAGHPRYECVAYIRRKFDKSCRGVTATPIDALVTQQVLRVLEPASLELSIQAAENLQHERERLGKHWKQQLERSQYESRRAERHYRSVDPENRLVARTLEQEWEAALHKERQTKEDFDRFQCETPPRLTSAEQEKIRSLASDIPALWESRQTTPADRKEIIRSLVERVVVNVRGDTEHVDVTIHWFGGFVSQHAVVRPVWRYDQLENFDSIVARIRAGRAKGLSAAQIAECLNREGFRSPCSRADQFTKSIINAMESRLGIRRPLLGRDKLSANEWWLPDLAGELRVNTSRMHHWLRKGYFHARKEPAAKFWIIWADAEELARLQHLRDYVKAERHIPFPKELTQPKPRQDQPKASDAQGASR